MLAPFKKFLNAVSDAQIIFIMAIFYLLLLWPFAVFVRMMMDCFGRKMRRSQWQTKNITSTLRDPTKQF